MIPLRQGSGGHAPRGGYKRREPGSLKEAVAELVHACGGQARAAECSRVSRAQINRYTDDSDEHGDCYMPVDIVLRLEEHCGEPIVTRYLAAAQRKIVLDVDGSCTALPTLKPHEKLAQVAEDGGRLMADASRALYIGEFDATKAPRIRRECFETIYAVSRLLESLPA